MSFKDPHAPFVALEEAKEGVTSYFGLFGMDCLAVNFSPKFPSVSKLKLVEFIFLVDRSRKRYRSLC